MKRIYDLASMIENMAALGQIEPQKSIVIKRMDTFDFTLKSLFDISQSEKAVITDEMELINKILQNRYRHGVYHEVMSQNFRILEKFVEAIFKRNNKPK